MLISRRRLDTGMDAREFIDDLIRAREIRVLPISAEIAALSQSDVFAHGDPADRLIAATAILHRATLVSSDAKLRKLKEVAVIW